MSRHTALDRAVAVLAADQHGVRDLARQNEIVACGYDVLRFTSQDVLERPDEVCARVAILLARDD